MSNLFSLDGRTALVTGASRGIGRAIALGLAEHGADVVCHSRRAGGADEVIADIRAMGRRAIAVHADLGDADGADQLVNAVLAQDVEIDVLVNNAGTISRAPATEVTLPDWHAVLRPNLDATFVLAQRFGREMLVRGEGKIINVASLLAFQGGINVPAYTASKHAVAGLTKALANEWARRGVNVNAIAPGYIRTDNTKALQEDAERAPRIQARIPAARWGDASDLVGAAVFLASRASDYVHGHLLVVDGGWMSR